MAEPTQPTAPAPLPRGKELTDNELRALLAENFSQEELPALFKAGSTAPPEMRRSYLLTKIQERQQSRQRELDKLRADPSFQEAVAEEQLKRPVDMADEADSFLTAAARNASPLVGGRGGSVDILGELADVKDQNPGRDVQIISVPTQNGLAPQIMVEQEDGTYKPSNRPGISEADFGAMAGDLFTLESVGSLLPYTGGPGGRILTRAFVSALGAGAGAAADEVLNTVRSDEDLAGLMSRLAQRGSMGALMSFGGELVSAGLGHSAQRIFAGATMPASQGEKTALERARRIMEYGAPVYAGQVSPNSWIARMRSRWAQLDPALQEQVLSQVRWLEQDQRAIAEQYLKMDGVDQAIAMAGMDLNTLDRVEREIAGDLSLRAQQQLGMLGQPPKSRSRAGQEVKEALFDLSNKDVASYRQLGNALLSDLDNRIMDAAEDAPFNLEVGGLKREAQNALDYFNAYEQRAGRISENLDTGDEMLNVGVRQVRQKYSADMKFVLGLLADLPDEGLPSNGIIRVRAGGVGEMPGSPLKVDGNGNIRTTYEVKGEQAGSGTELARPGEARGGPGGETAAPQGPVIGTYEVNGVQLLRIARSKLREYFSNPLMPVKDSEAQLAKKLYLQIGEVMENTRGSPAFADAVRRYNKASRRFLGTMDTLRQAGFAKEGDGKAIVTALTSGEMGFDTLRTLRQAMRATGERGGVAWQGLRNGAIKDMLNNPEKIRNLDIDPQTTGLWLDENEQAILRDYATQLEVMNRQGPRAIGARASGTRGRALALFSTVPDNDTFKRLWSHMDERDRNIMRHAVIEDTLLRASGPGFAETGVLNPGAYARRVEHLLSGDSGDRMKILFADRPETLEQLRRGEEIAAFYQKNLGLTDTGASIAASELAGGVQTELQRGDLGGAFMQAVHVRLSNILSASLAEGTLGKVFSPRVLEPNDLIGYAQGMSSLLVQSLDANQRDADPGFEKRMAEAARRAQAEVQKKRRARGATP